MKVITASEAANIVADNSSVMIGGFLGCGTPDKIIAEMINIGKKNLEIIGNDSSFVDKGIGRLIANKMVKIVRVSHIGTNPETQKQMIEKEIEVELIPQGTLAERVRAAGVGLGGILTPVGVGTVVEEGKKVMEIDGVKQILETPISADYALIKARTADQLGNLVYSLTARNFNPLMAMAAKTVIAEVDEILPVGCLSPDSIHTPGVLIDYIVVGGRK